MSEGHATHQALELSTSEAVSWCADHPEYWVFPSRMVDDGEGGWTKKPDLVSWTKAATKDPEEVRRLWDSVGGRAVMSVACAPSGIFVIDEDKDVEDPTWKSVLDMVKTAKMTRVLKSCTKGRPHYIFKQPATGDPVAEGRWASGDVKAAGIIFISTHDPEVDAPINYPPAGLLALLKRRPKGAKGRGLASYEALNNWLRETPEHLILGTTAQEKFLARTVEKMEKDVDAGEHRRSAALAAVYHAALEAAAGCYSAEDAFIALRDTYQALREGDTDPGKGWTEARQTDYDAMWASLVPEFKAGDHDDEVSELRDDLFERGISDEEEDDFEDLSDWFERLIDADVKAAERAVRPPVAEGSGTPELINPAPEVVDSGPKQNQDSPDAPASDEEVQVTVPAVPKEDYDPEVHGMRGVDKIPLELGADAFWGVHGEFIEAARPYTEASDAGLLAVALACAGVYFSETAYFNIGNAPHGPNVFVLGVGESSMSRKTTALQAVRPAYFPPDGVVAAPIVRPRDFSGIASGERLIHLWEPEIIEPHTDPVTGVHTPGGESWPEARVLWIESEAGVLFKRAHRDGATMTETVCTLWDQGELQHYARTASDVRVPPDRYRCGFIGLTTFSSIQKNVTDVEIHAGLGNRLLWFYLPDTGAGRDLPRGGTVPQHIHDHYRVRLDLASRPRASFMPVEFTPDAWELWESLYGELKRQITGNGMVDALTSRNAPQVARLALNYHLSNGGKLKPPVGKAVVGAAPVVGIKALKAALAVWDYSRASVNRVFTGMSGDPDVDELVYMLRQGHGWIRLNELKMPGRKSTTVDKAVKAKVVQAGVFNGRGRPTKVIGIREWVTAGRLTYPHPKDKDGLRWF